MFLEIGDYKLVFHNEYSTGADIRNRVGDSGTSGRKIFSAIIKCCQAMKCRKH